MKESDVFHGVEAKSIAIFLFLRDEYVSHVENMEGML
jgi:hypothetical protein